MSCLIQQNSRLFWFPWRKHSTVGGVGGFQTSTRDFHQHEESNTCCAVVKDNSRPKNHSKGDSLDLARKKIIWHNKWIHMWQKNILYLAQQMNPHVGNVAILNLRWWNSGRNIIKAVALHKGLRNATSLSALSASLQPNLCKCGLIYCDKAAANQGSHSMT